jgi:hypothetical protein
LPTTTCWGLSFLRCVTSFRSTCVRIQKKNQAVKPSVSTKSRSLSKGSRPLPEWPA